MGSKFLFLIPARSGSKGIPHKNIKNFCGKPLMAWTIEEAKKSKYCHTLVLSSDSEEYLEIGREYGCDYTIKRPEILSNESASSIDVIKHVIEEIPGNDYIVLLQPTSPLRNAKDIDNAIELMLKSNENSCVSINETKESPYWMFKLDDSNTIKMLFESGDMHHQRQSIPKVYSLNGAIYIKKISDLVKQKNLINEKTLGYIMSSSRSYDIDTTNDFEIAELMFLKLLQNEKP